MGLWWGGGVQGEVETTYNKEVNAVLEVFSECLGRDEWLVEEWRRN